MASVRVAVRVRPLNKREKKSKVIVRMKDNTTSLVQAKVPVRGDGPVRVQGDGAKTFAYDFSYDSTDRKSPDFVSQKKADKGLIPRICEGLFCEISARNEGDAMSFRTEVSYLEIYNEHVLDLLNKRPSSAPKGGLRVREHPWFTVVESVVIVRWLCSDLSRHVVQGYGDVGELMATGNANRTTASTGMNDASSRSHAIFTIHFTQARFDSELPCEMLSKIHLVDLAGSERADATRATGTRLKEGANINKSLVTLGSVISALADMSDKQATKKQTFIPYRDSVLTWLLKDSLGGNSKTIMIATISPADVNYGETLSTLRYASRAKSIVNSPTVNEDASVKVIRELQEEIARLRGLLDQTSQEVPLPSSSTLVVEERLQQSETKVLELTKEWTNKWWETENILKDTLQLTKNQHEEILALRKEGSGVVLDSQLPHLIGIDKDLLSTGVIIYHLKEGRTLVGSDEASDPQDIALLGPGRRGEHCVFENRSGAVSLIPHGGDAPCLVNGVEVTRPCQLNQGAIIQLGQATIFRFNHPTEAAQLRQERQNGQPSSLSLSMTDLSKSNQNLAKWMLLHPRSVTLTGEELCAKESPRTVPGLSEVSEQAGAPQQPWATVGGERAAVAAVVSGQGTPTHCHGNGDVSVAAPGDALHSPIGPPPERHCALREGDALDSGSRLDVLVAASVYSIPQSRAPPELTPSAGTRHTVAIPGKCPVPHFTPGVAGAAVRGGVGTGEGQEQEGHPSHKSGPGLVSTPPNPSGASRTGTGVRSCGGGEPRSGGVGLQQTGVLGPGDGCGAAPEGDANESQGVGADFCKGRPGSGGSSLGSTAACHLRSAGGTSCGSAPPQTAARTPPLSEDTRNSPEHPAAEAWRLVCGEMDNGHGGAAEGIPEESEPEAAAVSEQRSRLGSLVSRVSGMFPGAGRLLGRLPGVSGLRETRWSSQVASLIKRSQVLNAVKTSQMFSLITESYAFSLVKDSAVFVVVSGFPLIHRLQLGLSQPPPSEEIATGKERNPSGPNPEAVFLPTQSGGGGGDELPHNSSWVEEEGGLCSARELGSKKPEMVDIQSKEDEWSVAKELALPAPRSCKSQATAMTVDKEPPTAAAHSSIITLESLEDTVTVSSSEGVPTICQNLLRFPDIFIELQSMPLPELMASLRSLIPSSVFRAQKTVALYWLAIATCSRPRPALVILLEAGLYALTCDAGSLAVSHHFPLCHLREVHVGLAGQGLRLTVGALVVETVLGLHTHSRRLTQEVCRTLLGVLCPGDSRVSRHPLLHGDLASMSLDWHTCVPDLLLDAGLKVTCQFRKTLADLVYFLHSNMPLERPSVAEVQVLLYTSVRVCTSPRARAQPLAYFLLTETHLGLVQEDAALRPAPPHAAHSAPHHRSHFSDLSLRSRADVRCLLLHDAEGRASARVDVILAEGRPGDGTPRDVQLPDASKSSPHAEVWKLTFSCATEAACLINHLSNV
ncbi:Kinesin-like protein KIF16B [Merluccius polli]|uniref:Kinesin-like protein KIF16B n=1 Tax=Merluccius polli TaxID=89951 RepID=A0AA47NXL3_MERPO|nr:Kinesin-like protein KIF16B [Merluccius polli]